MHTGVAIEEALEAAHICAYRGQESHHPRNGLLLRADLHLLFDRYLFGIEPISLKVALSDRLKASNTYAHLQEASLVIQSSTHTPSRRALGVHWNLFLTLSCGKKDPTASV